MKKFLFVTLLLIAGVYGGVIFNAQRHINDPINPNHVAAQQAKTSHMLNLKSEEGLYGWCTGTAIAPHAILTAEHCAEHGELSKVALDYGLQDYKVTQILHDKNEHVILLLDGPALTDIQEYKTREPKIGEHEFFYGFGGKEYPAKLKSGVVLDEYDPSEANKANGLMYYSAASIPGDSGAAVYGDDGSMLTLVTFHVSQEYLLTSKAIMGGYALRFTPKQIEKAKKYVDVRAKHRETV